MKLIIKLIKSVFIILGIFFFISFIAGLFKNNQSDNNKPFGNEFCRRVEPYSYSNQLKRSISLVIERYEKSNWDWVKEEGSQYKKISNCIDIEYSDLSSIGAEGVFQFDENESTPENLIILVDQNYTNLDDLSSALLLSHELTHAWQFVREYYGGSKIDCVQKETEAYSRQALFAQMLNKEESSSIISRIEMRNSNSGQINFYEQLVEWMYQASISCKNNDVFDQKCLLYELTKNIKTWVISQPIYQKQCEI